MSKWEVGHDRALKRLFAYLAETVEFAILGSLSPSDYDGVVIRMFTDSDFSGEIETSHSTNGAFVDAFCEASGRFWPVSWASKKQGCTASAACEAETVALSTGIRGEGIAIQSMMSAFLGRLVAEVDNTQTIAAVDGGHSKKLRHIARTQRVSIGFLHDLVSGDFGVRVEYCRSDEQKADLFTKGLLVHSFVNARSMIGVEPELIVDKALQSVGRRAA